MNIDYDGKTYREIYWAPYSGVSCRHCGGDTTNTHIVQLSDPGGHIFKCKTCGKDTVILGEYTHDHWPEEVQKCRNEMIANGFTIGKWEMVGFVIHMPEGRKEIKLEETK